MDVRPLVLALVRGAQQMPADWPQILGPGRNGVYAGPPLCEAGALPAHAWSGGGRSARDWTGRAAMCAC